MNDKTRTLHVTIDAGHGRQRGGAAGAKNSAPKNKLVQNQTMAVSQSRVGSQMAEDGSVRPRLQIDMLSRLLSERNIDLLRMIKTAQPGSVAELARLSGRPKASLTLTLRRLERFGIVVFKTASGRRKIPTVVCDRLMLEVSIDK